MRARCGRRDRPLIGPRLGGAADAVEALRLSVGSGPDEQCVVVLACDEERRVVLALDFAGAPVVGAPQVMELVVAALAPGGPYGVVVGLFAGEPKAAVVAEIEAICSSAGVDLLDVLVVWGDDWWSVLGG